MQNTIEQAPNVEVQPPVVESFLDMSRATEVWPETVSKNEAFVGQVEKRIELTKSLDDVMRHLPRPDVSLESAIARGHITEEKTAKLYAFLSDLFEHDGDYAHLALYIPFEFLPDATWTSATQELQQASARFKGAYMETWKSLLSMHSVRANFLDGDILEADQRTGDFPRVVKAAHLIPKLVEKGLMQADDALSLMETSADETLRQSIADTLPVLSDMGLLTQTEMKRMESSQDSLAVRMARIIASATQSKVERMEATNEAITFSSIEATLRETFSLIDTKERGDISKKRIKWLVGKEKQEAIASSGNEISVAILDGTLISATAEAFLAQNIDAATKEAFISGVRQAVESAPAVDAPALYARYKEALLTLWREDASGVHEALVKTFARLHSLTVVDEAQLSQLNIQIPKLAGPFSDNLKFMKPEIHEIRKMIASVESNPELSSLIYPVALVYGSRLKGYGGESADIDLAVFIKPGTSFDDRTKLQALLAQTFSHERIEGNLVEFWLEETPDGLAVQDFPQLDVLLGEPYDTHVLFGAAWEGDAEVMQQLREKLLVPYMYDQPKEIRGMGARKLYIEEIERDALQYRLMHKGYEKFFAPYGGIHTPHADSVDGKSMFWDSGYRQMATKLFVNRVFLPKIPKPKK